jgi:hypothetical protein
MHVRAQKHNTIYEQCVKEEPWLRAAIEELPGAQQPALIDHYNKIYSDVARFMRNDLKVSHFNIVHVAGMLDLDSNYYIYPPSQGVMSSAIKEKDFIPSKCPSHLIPLSAHEQQVTFAALSRGLERKHCPVIPGWRPQRHLHQEEDFPATPMASRRLLGGAVEEEEFLFNGQPASASGRLASKQIYPNGEASELGRASNQEHGDRYNWQDEEQNWSNQSTQGSWKDSIPDAIRSPRPFERLWDWNNTSKDDERRSVEVEDILAAYPNPSFIDDGYPYPKYALHSDDRTGTLHDDYQDDQSSDGDLEAQLIETVAPERIGRSIKTQINKETPLAKKPIRKKTRRVQLPTPSPSASPEVDPNDPDATFRPRMNSQLSNASSCYSPELRLNWKSNMQAQLALFNAIKDDHIRESGLGRRARKPTRDGKARAKKEVCTRLTCHGHSAEEEKIGTDSSRVSPTRTKNAGAKSVVEKNSKTLHSSKVTKKAPTRSSLPNPAPSPPVTSTRATRELAWPATPKARRQSALAGPQARRKPERVSFGRVTGKEFRSNSPPNTYLQSIASRPVISNQSDESRETRRTSSTQFPSPLSHWESSPIANPSAPYYRNGPRTVQDEVRSWNTGSSTLFSQKLSDLSQSSSTDQERSLDFWRLTDS